MNDEKKGRRKITASVITVVVLAVCLCATTFALTLPMVSVNENKFELATVAINLNDGKPVITEDEYLFEPGMTVPKDFFIENLGSVDVYYKLYFENMTGGLADVLDVTITDGEGTVLYTGKMSAMTRDAVTAADDALAPGEKRELTITFTFPEKAGNVSQNERLEFDMSADAVQARNNDSRLFE